MNEKIVADSEKITDILVDENSDIDTFIAAALLCRLHLIKENRRYGMRVVEDIKKEVVGSYQLKLDDSYTVRNNSKFPMTQSVFIRHLSGKFTRVRFIEEFIEDLHEDAIVQSLFEDEEKVTIEMKQSLFIGMCERFNILITLNLEGIVEKLPEKVKLDIIEKQNIKFAYLDRPFDELGQLSGMIDVIIMKVPGQFIVRSPLMLNNGYTGYEESLTGITNIELNINEQKFNMMVDDTGIQNINTEMSSCVKQ